MKKIPFGQFFWAEAFFLCFLLLAKPLAAQELAPFQTQNQSPLVQIYGLPAPGEAFVLSKGKSQVGLIADLANNYATDSASREDILLDGESYRFTLEGRYGLGHGVEVGLEVPYIAFSGGF